MNIAGICEQNIRKTINTGILKETDRIQMALPVYLPSCREENIAFAHESRYNVMESAGSTVSEGKDKGGTDDGNNHIPSVRYRRLGI